MDYNCLEESYLYSVTWGRLKKKKVLYYSKGGVGLI